jgi:hypothetical protein
LLPGDSIVACRDGGSRIGRLSLVSHGLRYSELLPERGTVACSAFALNFIKRFWKGDGAYS